MPESRVWSFTSTVPITFTKQEALPVDYATTKIAFRIICDLKPPYHNVGIPSRSTWKAYPLN
jgi:hypothetical protein